MVNAWIKTEIFPHSDETVFIVRSDGVETSSITSFLRELGRQLQGRDSLPDFSGKNARV